MILIWESKELARYSPALKDIESRYTFRYWKPIIKLIMDDLNTSLCEELKIPRKSGETRNKIYFFYSGTHKLWRLPFAGILGRIPHLVSMSIVP